MRHLINRALTDARPACRGALLAVCGCALALLGACESLSPQLAQPAEAGATAAATAANSPAGGPVAAGSNASPAAPGTPLSPKASADFNRAVGVMRGGNAAEAELQFKQMTLAYPSLSAPYVNLGILYRRSGDLEHSEQALQNAVERNAGSAVAWNELGATQRLRGKFPDAAAAYEKAIAADTNFAPAYRNLGVVADLYLGDPERALTALERYKELTGEERPVTSWIAELRQRTGKPAVKAPAPASSAGDAAGSKRATPAAAEPAQAPKTGGR